MHDVGIPLLSSGLLSGFALRSTLLRPHIRVVGHCLQSPNLSQDKDERESWRRQPQEQPQKPHDSHNSHNSHAGLAGAG